MGKRDSSSLRQTKQLIALAMFVFCLRPSFAPAREPIVPTDGPIDLLKNGLGEFYTWSRDTQYRDPLHVYTYAEGVLQISGEAWGGPH